MNLSLSHGTYTCNTVQFVHMYFPDRATYFTKKENLFVIAKFVTEKPSWQILNWKKNILIVHFSVHAELFINYRALCCNNLWGHFFIFEQFILTPPFTLFWMH